MRTAREWKHVTYVTALGAKVSQAKLYFMVYIIVNRRRRIWLFLQEQAQLS